MPTTEERLAALEIEFAEIKKMKGVLGPRGPAGPIDAAVTNARAALAEDLADTLKKCTELQHEVDSFNGKLDNKISEKIDNAATALQQQTDRLFKYFENEVRAIVLQTLQEYFVLDSECRVLDHLQRPIQK